MARRNAGSATRPQEQPYSNLTGLPEPLRQSIQSVSEAQVSTMPDIVSFEGLFDDEEAALPSSAYLPPPPRHAPPPPTPAVSSQASAYLGSQSQTSQYSSSQQSQVPPRRSESVLSVQSETQAGRPHWDDESIEILIKAVHNHNPYRVKSNIEQGKIWTRAWHEISQTLQLRGMPKRLLPACKTKWTEISRDRKQALALSRSASGIVEYTSDLERLIDDVISSKEGIDFSKSLKAAAEAHRHGLANLLGEPQSSAAVNSTSSMHERAQQQSVESLHSVAEEDDSSIDTVITPRKRSRNAANDAVQLMIAQDERNREDDIRYQEEHLKVIKEEAEISREQTNIQRQMVEMGSAFLDTMKTDINSVKSEVQLMSNRVAQLDSV